MYSKFFDNMGPIPHHMHQIAEQAALVGQEGKPESYYFPPQHNAIGNNFPYTFFGLEPGHDQGRAAPLPRGLEPRRQRHSRPLGGLPAQAGHGLAGSAVHPPCPGLAVTYEPQWGSDVFGMYQSLVEGREVPWELLVKDMPKEKHRDLDFIVDQLDWEANVDPHFKENHYLEPIPVADTGGEGYVDRWIVYGKVRRAAALHRQGADGRSGCEVHDSRTTAPTAGSSCRARAGSDKLRLRLPEMIRFDELTEDEVFCTAEGGKVGVVFENTRHRAARDVCATSGRT